MRDKEAYVGKQNLGPCTVISYLMIFSYNLVHATGVNWILALQPIGRPDF